MLAKTPPFLTSYPFMLSHSHRKLETSGPKWQHPSLQQVLLGVPFLAHMNQQMFDWLR